MAYFLICVAAYLACIAVMVDDRRVTGVIFYRALPILLAVILATVVIIGVY